MNARDVHGGSCLTIAARVDAKVTLVRLLAAGANPWVADYKGLTVEHWCGVSGRVDVLRVMHKLGMNLRHPDGQGLTPLHRAITLSHFPTAEYLMSSTDGEAVLDFTSGHILSPIRCNATGDASLARRDSGQGDVVVADVDSDEDREGVAPVDDDTLGQILQVALDLKRDRHLRQQAIQDGSKYCNDH